MKISQLKQLIKEAVREAVREEVGLILLEQKQHSLNENLSFTTKDVDSIGINAKMKTMFGNNKKQPISLKQEDSKNPFLAFIQDSEANMTPEEKRALRNYGND